MNKSKIEWTDRTWNPVTGCTKVSQGCKNCYAERLYERFNGHGSFKNVLTHPERLQQPQKWKHPSKIFVNSMSDLFHEDVPFAFIQDVFEQIACNKRHIFQVLTKRPARMLEFLYYYSCHCEQFDGKLISDNIWLGVSVEDQATANERISLLLQVPAAVKFLSCEPLLGPVNFEKAIGETLKWHAGGLKNCINWVICGGESGPKARPMHPDWTRSLRDQCEAAGVPFFFKQWGEFAPVHSLVCNEPGIKGKLWHTFDPDTSVCKIGKKSAGNLLDGVQHLEFPTNQQITAK